jgi:pseudouridine kinase
MAPDLRPHVICIGGALVDRKYRLKGPAVAGSSNPAEMSVGFGGVARNVAETLARLGVRASLAAAVGDDAPGRDMLAQLASLGVDLALIQTMPTEATAEYAAVLCADDSELVLAVVAMDAAEHAMEARITPLLATLPKPAWLFADANLSADTLRDIIARAWDLRAFLAIDTVSVAKAARLPPDLDGVALMVMNRDEAVAYLDEIGAPADLARALRKRGAAAAVITCGAEGAVLADAGGIAVQSAFPAQIVDVTGAGDSLVAALLWRLTLGDSLREALRWGATAASLTVETGATVHPGMSPGFLAAGLSRMPPA